MSERSGSTGAFLADSAKKAPPTAIRALAPLALMGLIFYLSAQPDPGPDTGALGAILAHAFEYALLAALWTWTLAPALGRRAIVAAAAISLIYAVSDEYHQSFVPDRDADPLDVVVDAVGIAVAALAIGWAARSRQTARRALGPPA